MREVIEFCETRVVDLSTDPTMLAIVITSILFVAACYLITLSAFYYSRTGPFKKRST